jgi:RHS repeat-associated protein
MALSYGNNLQDFKLRQIANSVGITPVSQFDYGWDVPRDRIVTWSQQVGAQPPDLDFLGYDADGQLLSAVVTNSRSLVNSYGYTYDPAGNRLTDQTGATLNTASYNSLNQLSTDAGPGLSYSNEWNAMQCLTAVNAGNQRTEFAYDSLSRLASIRQLESGAQTSFRRLVWSGGRICEERDQSNNITKYYLPQGVSLQTGTNAGAYYYTADHIGSIRELTDSTGAVRARYAYDPWGRRTKLSGDLEIDFGFAGMLWSQEANLSLTHFRAYDPNLGRWLSRDPLDKAEILEGPNLYTYAANDPVNLADPSGLSAGELMLRPGGELSGGGAEETASESVGELMLRGAGDIAPYAQEGEEVMNPLSGGVSILWRMEQLESSGLPYAEILDLRRILYEGRVTEMWLEETITTEQYMRRRFNFDIPLTRPSPLRPTPRFSAAGELIGMGITVLTMTDCNTVNGIVALARVKKGGLLNVYEDQMMKQLDQFP